jgi:GT2 family glycosyltransferase/glycosyltransferase involved in cell wall biosynthesis
MMELLIGWTDRRLALQSCPAGIPPWTRQGRDPAQVDSGPSAAPDVKVWLSDLNLAVREAARRGPKRALRLFAELRTLRQSPFDAAFYRSQLDAAQRDSRDPVHDYVLGAGDNMLDPAPFFSTAFYLRAHRDVAAAGINPYVHFLGRGHVEGRRFEPSNFGTGRPANYLHVEDWQVVPWPARQAKSVQTASLYDQRPDDLVVPQSKAGEAFLSQNRLLNARPDFAGSVRALQDLETSLMSDDAPDVSIVIPVYGQLAYTLNCLDSLYRHASKYSMEILVGDDASPDETSQWLSQLERIHYVRHAQNGGFIQNCNATAERARGRFVVFLNNDTRVVDGWLDGLIDSFSAFPDAGLVGSKLFYPDASLQEAGGIVWRDGSAWNYGRNDDPNRSRYSHARKVDYVSGCSIAVRRETWHDLGGFDTHFAPAYYEDTDLAFRVRGIGLAVYMQPLSKVIHYEGKTSGTSLAQGVKAYQVENHRKFYDRWKDVLANHRESGAEPWLERQRDIRKCVLVIDTVTPTPTRDAGSVVTVGLMRVYQALGYHVLFLPEDNFLFDASATAYLQGLGIECLYAPYETSLSDVLRRYSPYLSVLQVIRPEPARRALDALAREGIRLKTLYLNADLHFLRLQRQAQLQDRADLLQAADEMKAVELDILRRADATFVHSSYERDLLLAERPDAKVEVLPLAYDVAGAAAPLAERKDVIFVGSFNHPPNLDAATWLIEAIWPKLEAMAPEAKLLIVGADPPEALRAMASDRILITGHVASLTPWFERSRVFIAPLRFGAGAKGKVVSSMAHGVPVVATSLAVEGMDMDAGRVGFVAETADDLAARVAALYAAPDEAWLRLSRNGLDIVAETFSPQAMTNIVKTTLDEVGSADIARSSVVV